MISGFFLQSKEWENFQKSLKRKTFRIESSLIIKLPLMAGFSYLYCPKGPEEITQIFIEKITKLAKQEKSIFLRFEPNVKGNPLHFKKCKGFPFTFIKIRDYQPACTQILNLTKSEDELLAEMKQKTRYNIRLAKKKEIKIKNGEFEIFYKLITETYSRQGIRMHPKEYYKKLTSFNKIFIAYYNENPMATAMVNFYNNTATYLHGGSAQKDKQVMAPYLLHWEIIKYAKKEGYKIYDWWGVNEKKWPGITKFKTGFGGQMICAPGTFDIPLNKWLYKLYKLLRR